MREIIKKQIKLEEKLRKKLIENSSSENFAKVYDEYHKFILNYGFPREGRDKTGFLYFSPKYKNLAEKIIFNLVSPRKEVLEIGSGDGNLSYKLATQKSCRVVGIDISEIAISVAKRRIHPNLSFLRADARALPFKNSTFDYVISKDLLEHLPAKDHEGHLKEVKRVLKEKGIFLLYTPPKLASFNCQGLHLKQYLLKELSDFLSSHFKKIKIYNVQLAKLNLYFRVPDRLLKLVYVYEDFLNKTRLYKLLKPFNKFLIFRGVFEAKNE